MLMQRFSLSTQWWSFELEFTCSGRWKTAFVGQRLFKLIYWTPVSAFCRGSHEDFPLRICVLYKPPDNPYSQSLLYSKLTVLLLTLMHVRFDQNYKMVVIKHISGWKHRYQVLLSYLPLVWPTHSTCGTLCVVSKDQIRPQTWSL